MKKLILIIEDNEDIRENSAELLTLAGFEVIVACNGGQALELIGERKPDVIICDIVMGDMDGYEVLSQLKQNALTSDIPFIFSSALSEKKDQFKAWSLGAAHYLVKPFDVHELMSCIDKCLTAKPRLRKGDEYQSSS
ncbi:hypothetical protein BEL04_06935 [Mucilaginibacter sp. PPCGB 2223]|uniref:response regulator n=1 Tax=Mucilaginibacter sp. PPCGB 2223 TaxID=1886027 RepID=UPI000825FFD7|nr:response regulator [Mucilaginibacter sp. PPCGB 2223]OCX54004.1 hypothetical protein BEL04_06935 [Mucilaginibacter sp. PPCGB 2223]